MAMKKKEPDLARELASLLEEYTPYKEADISFLLRQMMLKSDSRFLEYRKKADATRRAYREGRLKKGKGGSTGLA
jgi:hypothetical protein